MYILCKTINSKWFICTGYRSLTSLDKPPNIPAIGLYRINLDIKIILINHVYIGKRLYYYRDKLHGLNICSRIFYFY